MAPAAPRALPLLPLPRPPLPPLLFLLLAPPLLALDPGRPAFVADMGAYLSTADMLWGWDASSGPLDPLAPTRWYQGAYLGNGLLGAMVTAVLDPASNATTALRVDISRTDIWECAQREPTGFFTISVAGAPPATRNISSLWAASRSESVSCLSALCWADQVGGGYSVSAIEGWGVEVEAGARSHRRSLLVDGAEIQLTPIDFFWSASLQDNAVNASAPPGGGGYSDEGGNGFVLATQANGTVPLFSFFKKYSASHQDYAAFASNASIAWALAQGYAQQGVIGFVWPSQPDARRLAWPAGTQGALARVDMRLVLHIAQLFVNFTLSDQSVVSFSMLVNAADPLGPTGLFMLFVSTLTGGPDALDVYFTPDTTGPCSDKAPAQGRVSSSWGRPTFFATQTFSTGTATAAWTDFNDDCGQTILLCLANSQRSATNKSASLGDAIAGVAAGYALTIEGLEAANSGWWDGFWSQTSFFSFDDAGGRPGVTKLEQFAHIAGYRYASAARFTMHDLMGPWGPSHATTCIGPWCQYCWDMNQQVMMYLPVPSNRGALLGKPAFDMLPAALNNSWESLYGSNAPAGSDNLLWWAAQAWRYCLHHGDDARLLADILPVLRTGLQQSGLSNGTDGLLHVKSCTSPEYPMNAHSDCNYDLSIFRWAAQTGLAIASELAPGDPGLPLFRDVAARLAPYPVDPATGSFMVAAGLPFSLPHRHYSHLLMMFDLDLLSSANASVAAASLDVWWNITCAGPQSKWPDWPASDNVQCRGFTQAAMAAMNNQLNRSIGVLGNLTSYLRLVGLPNAMYGASTLDLTLPTAPNRPPTHPSS